MAEELSYSDASKGVVVAGVADGSNAAEAGFQRGDVIASVNGKAIETTRQLADVLSESASYIDLSVKRSGQVIRLRMSG